MKNNKGFSLVELIIVIAIMAILVGVMAPQLIKYIEKTNVSADIQLCKTIKTAMETAATDAAVANEPTYKAFKTGESGQVNGINPGGDVYVSSMEETLGCNLSQVDGQLKATLSKGKNVEYYWVSDSSVVVYIPGTDKNGSKTTGYSLAQTKANAKTECIYAGPVELY